MVWCYVMLPGKYSRESPWWRAVSLLLEYPWEKRREERTTSERSWRCELEMWRQESQVAAPASSLTSRMSRSPSRLHIHLFCVLPYGQEAAPNLLKPRNSRHLQVLFIVKSYVYQAIMLGSTIVLSFKLSRVIDILFFLNILEQPPPQASLLRRGSKRSL